MSDDGNAAPGWPGIEPRWTSSAKSGVGTSMRNGSQVWFTLSHGILDEVYFGRLDRACTRDMGLLVTDGANWVSEEKRDAQHAVSYLATGVPAYCLVNTDPEGRYRIEKEIITDPRRSVVLQRTRFVPLEGDGADLHLYVLLAPHLGNHGLGNTAWVGETKGTPMLFAERHRTALALGCSAPWLKRSAGFAGTSDGWLDLMQHRQMTWEYERAEDGNVALIAEIDWRSVNGEFVLALGFGSRPSEAGHYVRASLFAGFDFALEQYETEWQAWGQTLLPLGEEKAGRLDEYLVSAMVLRVHEDKDFRGGMIASLSIPWGFAKGDDDLGGYHLVWSRDLVEIIGGLMAAGAQDDAARVLRYLQVTQEADGHWPQNMWLDGTPYWTGIQMDEAAFPILLTEMAWREGALEEDLLASFWPMVRQAASYVAANGPVSQEDRWEENAGYAPFTLAVEIAGLLAAADLAELAHEEIAAAYLRETADIWNANIERWTYVTGTELAQAQGVDGYYERIAPPDVGEGASISQGYVPIKNRPPGQSRQPATQIISPDALALVRFGLRGPEDPRIVNTVKVIDATLKLDTRYGPIWHRYTDDGYGEHANGDPYDGTGIGRAWPLLVGERAHYELAAGRRQEAERLMQAMENFADAGGMIPEQVWDAPDIPDRELFFGRPSGSAMPLVWAHAEYIKLRRSLREKRVVDMPPQPVKRYIFDQTGTPYAAWRFNQKIRRMLAGKQLRVETRAPARVHWSRDGWQTAQDAQTRDTTLGIYYVDLPTQDLRPGDKVLFTFNWPEAGHWEGINYEVEVVANL